MGKVFGCYDMCLLLLFSIQEMQGWSSSGNTSQIGSIEVDNLVDNSDHKINTFFNFDVLLKIRRNPYSKFESGESGRVTYNFT